MKHPFRANGFSLAELALVLLMATTLMVAAVPALQAYAGHLRLDVAAQGLAVEMMKIRYLAVIKSCRYRLRFDLGRECYRDEEDLNQNQTLDPGEAVSAPFPLPAGVHFSSRGVLGPPSQPTTPPASPVTFTNGVMSVGPDGRWSNPGTVYLGNDTEEHTAISVAFSGRVRIWWWNADKCRWE